MQHLARRPKNSYFHSLASCVQTLVRFLAYHRIKPHAPPLVQVPVNSFEFHPCGRTPQVDYLSLTLGHWLTKEPTSSNQRLLHGLPGYLILFAPHAFTPQRQSERRELPSQLVFRVISTHSTATPHIPSTSILL